MTSLRGIKFNLDMESLLSELKHLFDIVLQYDDCELELHNVYYDNDDDFAIFVVTGKELNIDSPVVSYDFVFSFDECKLYKLTDTIFICISYLWRGENNKNPIELFNKVKEHINY